MNNRYRVTSLYTGFTDSRLVEAKDGYSAMTLVKEFLGGKPIKQKFERVLDPFRKTI